MHTETVSIDKLESYLDNKKPDWRLSGVKFDQDDLDNVTLKETNENTLRLDQ